MDDPLFDLGDPPAPPRAAAYRVLARKYRPQSFTQLIGQDAMVQTLGNAIRRDRLAHAFLLTGVRGVGKTSTARLIAKALNCVGPDGSGGPTIDPCGQCEPCRAIAEGRHIDVVEIDAASHNGVDDVREMTEAVRYAAVSARYKIYIIDEVHMMSKPAFNALLKTLEEPPSHVKFLLATTEVHKVPITVLSRCQRFDLRRIPAEKLAAHFDAVARAEGFEAEPEALALIARAAEGSARDGLSILDQAIAHAGIEGGGVQAQAVRAMLGLSDRGAVRDLLALLLAGDAGAALAALRRQYDLGIDPASVLRMLMETVHGITLAKVGAEVDMAQAAEEREALGEWARSLSFPVLHRLWQLLLRGYEETARAALPVEASEMALLRVIHAAQLPDPGELARRLREGEVAVAQPSGAPAPAPDVAATAALPDSLEAIRDLLAAHGRHALAEALRNHARIVRLAAPDLELSTARPIPSDFVRDLGEALRATTGTRWRVTTSDAPGAASLREAEANDNAAYEAWVREQPVVAAALAFPGAELLGPKTRGNMA
ncbi:DNA polymerase III subunit gamma/tau [Sphingomonas baiyangensis]|uniref:DNA polymerase III subunit gamma/tau n=1 Tax=Sphingomonas baiyangensis TaxID=2572576 RepID=A0A4U1L225_9SPHN|nr:DNA polymerase III subunit gamma/tau [Sphingomonas baiyangensis]TKD50911.1 DNA polymerase III subunit gamma/tau [Sphingomonas baiyangensis]